MAVGGLEVEIVAGGMEERPAERGPWVQNLWRPGGSPEWETRPGFGQVAQIDTSLSTDPDFTVDQWGYKTHLGSASVRTSWGAEHIVSVFAAQIISGHGDMGVSSRWTPAYLVSVFDLSTQQKWEEVIFRHTSENKDGPVSIKKWRGHFESYEGVDRQKFLGGIEAPFYFHTFQQTLFFGNKFTGTLAYRASDYRKARHQSVPSLFQAEYVKGYSETSRVIRVVPTTGLFPDTFAYRNETEIPEVVDITSVGDRLVVASANALFFSDPGIPNAFFDQNVRTVPSERDIVAVSNINNNVIVFTDSETFLYQPSNGENLAQGRFTLASGSIGCLGTTSTLTDGEVLYWVSQNGVHATSNGVQVQTLSDSIQPFFSPTGSSGGITSPLNHFLTASGVTDPTSRSQPRTLYRLSANETVSMALWSEYGALLFSSPSNNVIWCLAQNQWSMWNVESSVSTTAGNVSQVGTQNNIKNPFVLSANNKIYVVGGVDVDTFTSGAESVTSSSYYILEAGRGGSLDRSVESEDQRYVRSRYTVAYVGTGSTKGRFFMEEPVYDAASGAYWMPVTMVPNIAGSPRPTNATLRFTYDSTNWTLGTDVCLPTERLASAAGYTLTFPAASTAEIQYNSATPLEMADKQKNPFFILKWTPAAANTTKLKFDITPTVATSSDGVTTINMNVFVYQQHIGPLNADDSTAQPVDWVYRSGQIGVENTAQIKTRGLFSRFISHGKASTQLNTGWLWGLFNTLVAPDWKGWSSQVMDFNGAPAALDDIASKSTVRTRFKDVSGALNAKVFNAPTAAPPAPPKYSTPGAPSDGDYLVDDAEYDSITTSDTTRGEYVSYMMFGFLRNKAERLVLASSKALLRRNQGGPRRQGR